MRLFGICQKVILFLFVFLISVNAQEVDSIFNLYKVKVYTNEIPDTLIINGTRYYLKKNEEIISVAQSAEYKIIAIKHGYYTDKIDLGSLKKHSVNYLKLEFSDKKGFFHTSRNIFGESFNNGKFEFLISLGYSPAFGKTTFSYKGEKRIRPYLYIYEYNVSFEPGASFLFQVGARIKRFRLFFSYSKNELSFSEIEFKESVYWSSRKFSAVIDPQNHFINIFHLNASWMLTRVKNFGIGFIIGYHWSNPIVIEEEIEITRDGYAGLPITEHSKLIKLTVEYAGLLPGLYITWRPSRYLSLDSRAQYTSGYRIDNVSTSAQQGQLIFSFFLNGHF